MKRANKSQKIHLDLDVYANIKAGEYARGYQVAKDEYNTEVAKRKEGRALEMERLNTQSIDAICHAITALARLIDGRDAR